MDTYKKRQRASVLKVLVYALATAVSFVLGWRVDWMLFIPRVAFSGLFGLTGFLTLLNIVEFLLPLKSRGRFVYIFSNGLAFSEGKDIKICEDMAEQGYVLVSISRWGFYKLERAESQKLSYAIDYSDISRYLKLTQI
jgi:hypothetical protein